jgi:hypothetical protein
MLDSAGYCALTGEQGRRLKTVARLTSTFTPAEYSPHLAAKHSGFVLPLVLKSFKKNDHKDQSFCF